MPNEPSGKRGREPIRTMPRGEGFRRCRLERASRVRGAHVPEKTTVAAEGDRRVILNSESGGGLVTEVEPWGSALRATMVEVGRWIFVDRSFGWRNFSYVYGGSEPAILSYAAACGFAAFLGPLARPNFFY